MPLLPATLKSQLEAAFADPPATHAACAQAWADAVQAYAAGIVPPSAGVAAAAASLATALTGAFQTPDAVPGMESAFSTFAVAVGGSMAGYVPTPPVAPVGFALQFAGAKPETHALAAEQIGNLIHAWLTTGLSTLAVAPFTVLTWN